MRSKAANFIFGCCVMLYVPPALAEMACNFTLEKNRKLLFSIAVEGLGNFEERLIFIPKAFSKEDKKDLEKNGISLSKLKEYKFELQKDDNGDLCAVLFAPTVKKKKPKPFGKILEIPKRGRKKTADEGILQAFFPGPKKTKFRIKCGDEKVLLSDEKSVTVSDTSATDSGGESPQETDVSESVLSEESKQETKQETKEKEKTKIDKQPKRKLSQKADATKKKRGRKSKQDLQKESSESEDESAEQDTESAQDVDAFTPGSSASAPTTGTSTSVVICNDESNFESLPVSRQTSGSFQHLYGGLESLSGSGFSSILGNAADAVQKGSVRPAVSSQSSERPFLHDSVLGSAREFDGTRGLSVLGDSTGDIELDNDEPSSTGGQLFTVGATFSAEYSPMTLGNFDFSDFRWDGLSKEGMFNTLPDISPSSFMDTHDY